MSETGKTLVQTRWEDEWRVFRIILDTPPGNILDRALIAALAKAFETATQGAECGLVVFEGAGENFSFGASIQEHRPPVVTELLGEFHALIGSLLCADLPTLALVRGRCLGGGLELALACDFLVVAEDAELGLPEIRLGVFPPAASALLPVKLGANVAMPMLLGGRSLLGKDAPGIGLATLSLPLAKLESGFEAWTRRMILPHSSASLRVATHAARLPWRQKVIEDLAALERLYLDRVVSLPDATEGLDAFLGKRRPVWSHHG